MDPKGIQSVAQWLREAGFPEVELETQGELLILRLPQKASSRLLKNDPLRRQLVSHVRSHGFAKVALELAVLY